MHRLTITLFALAMLVVAPARADENPQALVEKAVEATGGLERLSQSLATRRKVKGHFHDDNRTFVGESFGEKGRIKISHKSENKDDPELRVLVMEGDKGWISFNGLILDLDNEMLARMKRARHADRVAGLTALLKDKGYALTYDGEVKVKDKPARAVRVKYEGQPDVLLYFDKQSGLLVKSGQKFTEPGNDAEVLHELYFLDYRSMGNAAVDEKLLKDAGIRTDSASLIELLVERTPKNEVKIKITRLIEQLREASFRARTVASAELKKLGPAAGPALRAALDDADTEVVRRARELLDRLAEHPDAQQVPAVLRLIALRKPQGAVPALLGYLPWAANDNLAEDVKAALAAVAWRDGKPDPAIVNAVRDSDATVRATIEAVMKKDREALNRQPGRRVLVEGLTSPRRCEMYRDGKRHMDLETLEVEFYNRHPDSLYLRPGEQPNPER